MSEAGPVELPDWGGVIDGCFDFPPRSLAEEKKWMEFFHDEGYRLSMIFSGQVLHAIQSAGHAALNWPVVLHQFKITKLFSVVDDVRKKTHVFVWGVPPGGVKNV